MGLNLNYRTIVAIALLLVISVLNATPQNVTLKKGSLICYDRGDWESMVSAIMDQNLAEMRGLLSSGKCQQTVKQSRVSYLDPVRGKAALIQMPSGRAAYVFAVDIQ